MFDAHEQDCTRQGFTTCWRWYTVLCASISTLSARIALLSMMAALPVPTQASSCSAPIVRCDKNGDMLANAKLLREQGYYRQAHAAARCALRQSLEPAQQIIALQLAGSAAVRFGDYAEARFALQRALDLSIEIGDRSLQARSSYALGVFQERQKNTEMALTYFRKALSLLQPAHDEVPTVSMPPFDRETIIETLFEIGDIEVSRSEFDRGIQSYQAAVTQPQNTSTETARALDYLGYAHRRLGDYSQAIEFHRQALNISERIPLGPSRASAEARARNHIGLCLHQQALVEVPNATTSAIALLQQARQELRVGLGVIQGQDGHDLRRQGYLLRALARVHIDLAQLQPADKALHLKLAQDAAQTGLSIAGKMCDEEWRGLALHALADIQALLGLQDEAEARLREAVTIWTKIGDRNALGYAWRRRAVLANQLPDQNAKVHEYLKRALSAFESIQARDDMVSVHVDLGEYFERNGKSAAARDAYYNAIQIVENTRAQVGGDENKIVYLSRRMRAYEALIGLLAREYQGHSSHRDGEEAFRVSELARGRVLLDLFAQSNAALHARVDPHVIHEEKRLVQRVDGLRRQLGIKMQNDSALRRLRTQLRESEIQLATYYGHLTQRYPNYVHLKQPVAARLPAVAKRALPSGAVLLEYFIGDKRSFLFVVKATGLAAVLELPVSRRGLTQDIEQLRSPFNLIKQKDSRQVGDYLHSRTSFDLALAERLYQQLFAPVETYLSDVSQIVLVPDGPLFHLPFEILVRRRHTFVFNGFLDDIKSSEFLVDYAPPFSYAISASLLLNARPPTSATRMAAFVNPTLRTAAAEVEVLEAMSNPTPKVYKGAQASRERFLKEASRYNSLYIATHGEFNEANPMRSGFWFSEGGRERGSLVSAADILNMSLPVRLLVLRACETGLGRIQNGEGLMGLARALKYAGARELVLSLWSVDDASSFSLMERFYTRLTQSGGPQALHQAKRRFRDSENIYLTHPFFWAPYTYWY